MGVVEANAILQPARRRGSKVALVAFGESMRLIYSLPEDVAIWSLNHTEEYDFPRLDALFEMHPLRDIILEKPRWQRLLTWTACPVFMLEPDVRFPAAVRYPLEQVLAATFEHLFLGDQRAAYMDSSLPYMLALAVLAGYQEIHIYGFELRSDTEYRYQRPGAALLIGWAIGRGVKVILPPNSALLPRTLYGYEDYQMISRQNLEQLLLDLQTQESDWLGRLNAAHARVLERQNADGAALLQAQEERQEAFKQVYMRAGAIHVITHLIALCDRKEQELQAFRDPLIVHVAGG